MPASASKIFRIVVFAPLLTLFGSRLFAEPLTQGVSAEEQPKRDAVSSVTFESDIQPLLTRFGCNAGACHGKSRGQNGFALSLLGFDSDFDYAALVHEARGRRIFPAAPESSLLLKKATAQLPHGGGARFDVDSAPYRLLQAWIENGAARTPADAPKLLHVSVEPASISLKPTESSQLRVVAKYSDGSDRDVTDASAFQSNDLAIVAVSPEGTVKAGPLPGESAIMARYMNNIAVSRVIIPLPGEVPSDLYDALPTQNKIDQLVWEKLKLLGMLPSASTSDARFHRRAYLRAIGRLPNPTETRAFLNNQDPNKRQDLIDHLLQQPEYADFWANKWADLLRPNPYRVGMKAVWALDAWLRESFRQNKPYDEFVEELVTAQGSSWRDGETVIFRDRPSTVEIASSVSQLFLGVRLECAKCHHHPFEVWSQDDFYGFAAFFSRVGHHGGLSPPISGGEELVFTAKSGNLKHGRTGELVHPKTLTGTTMKIGPDDEPRQVLADWMIDPSNPFFAKVMANRVWAEIMGKGLVDPVDDLRTTNPATNEPLLDYLADEFREHDFDIKHLIGTIMKSHVFGLSTIPEERNVSDVKNYSRYYRQRLRAEMLLDAVNDVLDVSEDFAAMPPESRATQIWTHRASSLFLDTFGRPDPNQDPPCERTTDSTTPQILHLMNSPDLNKKLLSEESRAEQLTNSKKNNEEVIEEIFLLAYCRFPTADEIAKALAIFPAEAGGDRRHAVEDLFWALLNTPEFLFID